MNCFGNTQQRPNVSRKQQIKISTPQFPLKESKDTTISTNQGISKDAVLFVNQFLDHRDQKIIIPFDKQKNQKVKALNNSLEEEVVQWLVRVNYTISSRGFRHLIDGNLTENECKAYTSKNILFNLKQYINSFINLKEEQKQELMTRIGQIETDILGEVMLKYPQNSLRGASKRIRSVIKKIDNRANDQYDFLLRNDIVINYQQDGHYSSELMMALNKMISFSGDIFVPEKGINDTQDTYFQIWSELVEYIVLNDSKKNQKRFFEGFDEIFNYEVDKVLPLLFQNSINQDSLKRKQKQDLIQNDTDQNLQESHRAKLKINHKIPLQAPTFTDDQILSGEFKIRNSSVLRVIAKWTYELLQKFRQSKDIILHRTQKFKLNNKKLSSLENNQKIVLYEAIKKQREKIEQYIVQLKKQYILLQTVFAQQKNRNIYQNEDFDIQVYALRIREIYSQYLFKLLSRLIHSLKKIPRQASQVYRQRYQIQIPEEQFRTNYEILKQVDLVTFKVGDLMRAKYSCSQIDFLRIYKNISEIHQNRPQMMKCIRIKNRLDQKDNDILLNVFFANKIICEIQLSFDRAIDLEGAQKKKYYTSFNHFLYEIRRSLLGPIGQFACILGEHDPVVSQYVLTDKNKALMNQNISKKCKKKTELQLPLIENQAQHQFVSDKILIQKHPGKEVKKLLTKIKEIYFLCEICGQLKKNINFDLLPDRRSIKNYQEDTTETQQIILKECKQCFLAKLQQLQENSRIHHLLDKIFKGKNPHSDLFYNHLRSWTIKEIPISFKKDEIYLYIPYEGFLLAKSSKLISFTYFKRFVDSNFIYFATKQNGKINVIYQISRILSEDEIYTQIENMISKYFVFKFDQNVSIQDGSILNYGNEGEYEVALCRLECCHQSIILGSTIMWQEFQQNINKQMIKKIFQYEKNVLYLNQMKLNNMINEVVMNDKRYDSACKSITMIQAEQSELTDIKFTSKMVNLSDLYIRQNKKLISLSGIENCRNLKILYCNECNLTSLKELSGLLLLQQLFVNQNQLTDLIGLQKCYNLKELSCYWNKISSINPIKGCKNLEYLQIGLNTITSLQPIESLTKLKHLSFCRNRIDIIEGIQELKSLKSIDFSHTNINNIAKLNKCRDLQKVICANTNIQNLSQLQILNLIYLDISECSKIRQFDLSRISCSSLQILMADNCPNLKRLMHLEFCKELRQLYINLNPSLSSEQFNLIGRCTLLQIINIGQNKNLKTLYFLQMLPNLISFTCSNSQNLDNTHFSFIRKCSKLQTLILNNNPYLMSMQFLKSCSKVYYLNLSGTNIKNIDKPPFYSKFQQLRYFQLKNIKGLQISSFEFLKQAKQIEKIVISQIYDVQSLKGLQNITSLKQLIITKLQKNDPGRNKRFAQQISKLSIKLQRAIRLEQELQI